MKCGKGFILALCVAFVFVSLSMAAPSHGENVLDKVEKTGKANMGFREGSVPFGFMNEKGEWVGFGLDLGHAAPKRSFPGSMKASCPMSTHWNRSS